MTFIVVASSSACRGEQFSPKRHAAASSLKVVNAQWAVDQKSSNGNAEYGRKEGVDGVEAFK